MTFDKIPVVTEAIHTHERETHFNKGQSSSVQKKFYLSFYCMPNKITDKVPARFNVAIMLFMACFIAYMVRVNISVNILAMVMPDNKTGTEPEPPDVS